MKPKISTGRLSDIVDELGGPRVDWSEVNQALKKLEPGDRLTLTCPEGINMGRFRSTVQTNASRIHKGDWKLRTKSSGELLHCFLIPRKTS